MGEDGQGMEPHFLLEHGTFFGFMRYVGQALPCPAKCEVGEDADPTKTCCGENKPEGTQPDCHCEERSDEAIAPFG